MKLSTVYLGTGSNVGNRYGHLQEALWQANQHLGKVVLYSSVYETAAWGITDQAAFLNQVIKIETPFSPKVLMQKILETEKRMGRIRGEKWGPRIIDIDILLYNHLKINTDGLHIPHPQITNRNFVLLPLAEIAGTYVHPIQGKTIQALALQSADALQVKKYL